VFNLQRDGPTLAEARRRAAAHEIARLTESFERLSAHDPEGEQAVLSGRASGMLPAK
jgi:hypothetical protein